MAMPYLRRGILLGDRPVTTTGAAYVSAALLFGDYLIAGGEEMERSGSTAFTSAYTHKVTLTYGYVTSKSLSLDDPGKVRESTSGQRTSSSDRAPRQSISIQLKSMTVAELAKYQRFYQMCSGSDQVIEFVDENGNAFAGRWVGGFQATKNPSNSVVQPFDLSIKFELEEIDESSTYRTGGQVSY